MQENNKLTITQRELLIRIDERQKSMNDRLSNIEHALINPNEYRALNSKVIDHESRLDGLEKWRIKIVAYATIASTVGAFFATILVDIIKSNL